jgi:DMSO/TMAO reductase YedYZ molybdopterin-dependent catalytic subunit
VSHAEWTGVSLHQFVDAAKPAGEASAVRLIGADGFSVLFHFTQARHPDTFVALTMNREKLPVNHGFPCAP